MTAPDAAATLLDRLELRARTAPDLPAVWHDERWSTFGEISRGVGSAAAGLVRRGVGPGARVVLVFPNGTDFIAAFLGVQAAGAVAVPLFPDSGAERVVDIARLCGAEVVVVSPDLGPRRVRGVIEAGRAAGLAVLTVSDIITSSRGDHGTRPDPNALAYLQYTSGSTGDPKGVEISHGNLVTNIRQMEAGFELAADDVFVSWLPMSHDMGLILMTLAPLFLGARLVVLPTSVASIRRWMHTIAHHGGTFTAAPDFAYRIAVRTARTSDRPDLGCLRVALNAAEPVRATTIADFEACFGLRRAVVPAYGLAEATVGVSGRQPGAPVRTDERGLVSVGRPFPGITVEIHGDDGPAAPSETGEIIVHGPAVARGYHGNPRATAELFVEGGGIRTGDVGYLDTDGELFIVGRRKSVIIQAGRTIAPQEIEETVDGLGFVRRSAAVGIDRGGPEGEQSWVFVELRPADAADRVRFSDMVVAVVRAVHRRLGFRPGRVYLTRPHTIPMTPNGKIRHHLLRRSWLDGTLRRDDRIVYPEH